MGIDYKMPVADTAFDNVETESGPPGYPYVSDNSDATWVRGPAAGDHSGWAGYAWTLGTPSKPSGAVWKEARLLVRFDGPNTGGVGYIEGDMLGHSFSWQSAFYTPTIFEFGRWPAFSPENPSSSGVMSASLRFNTALSGPPLGMFTFYDIWGLFVYVAKPVVNVTGPTSPVDDTTFPTVTWEDTLDGDGSSQTGFEARIVTGTSPTSGIVAQSGERTGSDLSWKSTASLDDGSYRAYARVKQTVNGAAHWSDWDYAAFTLAVDRPANPTISAAADNDNGRVVLTVAGAGGGAETTDYLEVQRRELPGDWEFVRGPLADGRIDVDAIPDDYADFESPNDAEVTYRVRAIHEFAPGDESVSDWVESAAAGWGSNDCWLKHPTDPSLNLRLPYGRIASYPGRTRPARQGVFQALGASKPVVVSDTRGGATGKVSIRLDTDVEQAAMDALLDTTLPLLLQVRFVDLEIDRWIAVGDADRNRIVDKSWVDSVLDELPWTEVERPGEELTIADYPAGNIGAGGEDDMVLV